MRHEGVKVIQSLSHPPYVGETLSRQYGGSDAQIYFPSSIVYNASFTRSYFLQPDVSAWLYFADYTCTFIVLWSWKIGTMMYT